MRRGVVGWEVCIRGGYLGLDMRLTELVVCMLRLPLESARLARNIWVQ